MNIAIILSGGIGSRIGGNVPKQYIFVNNKPIIWHCLRTFFYNTHIDAIVIVRALDWAEFIDEQIKSIGSSKPVFYAMPGETRQYSIYNGLKEIERNGFESNDIVIIHDAARPMVNNTIIDDCLRGCIEAEAVLPVIPVKDTLYQSRDGFSISKLLNRTEIFAGQAPEAFLFGKYLSIHECMSREELLKINGSTEIAYKGGMKVKLIRGNEMNFKITTPEDLINFENILKRDI